MFPFEPPTWRHMKLLLKQFKVLVGCRAYTSQCVVIWWILIDLETCTHQLVSSSFFHSIVQQKNTSFTH